MTLTFIARVRGQHAFRRTLPDIVWQRTTAFCPRSQSINVRCNDQNIIYHSVDVLCLVQKKNENVSLVKGWNDIYLRNDS